MQLGNWNSVFRRFRRWALSGVFERVFNALSEEFDLEYVLVDGRIVQAHQKASGARGDREARNRTLERRGGARQCFVHRQLSQRLRLNLYERSTYNLIRRLREHDGELTTLLALRRHENSAFTEVFCDNSLKLSVTTYNF